jgi:SAM-dependent methyltransferase
LDAPVARIRWTDGGESRSALWRCERAGAPPGQVQLVDDRLRADEAFARVTQGVGLLWQGDFHNARQLLTALAARVDRARGRPRALSCGPEAFHRERLSRSQRVHTLGRLLIPLEADYRIALRRAPDLRQACIEAWGPADEPSVVSLRELLGAVGAHEWRRRGIAVPAAGGRIHPHYGVFSPTRAEYVDLVAQAPLPPAVHPRATAFDLGTGTGVLAAVLARRGLHRVVATDRDPRALACARENLSGLGWADRVEVVAADPYPEGRAALIVCNPPWLPARPVSALEHAVYDPDSRMLRTVLSGLAAHLEPGGEGWLVMSDLAEHLGLRAPDALANGFREAGLQVVGRLEAAPRHPRATDPSDPLHAARRAERTVLWRLGVGTG